MFGKLIIFLSLKGIGGFKDKVICHFKLNAPKKAVYGREKKSNKLKKHKNNLKKKKFIINVKD